MKPIGIIGAMESEVERLRDRLDGRESVWIGRAEYHSGTLCGVPAVVVCCGIGKVCAAICTQTIIDRFDACAIVNTGVAGGLDSRLCVGDLVVAADAVQHDFDLSAIGYVRGYMPGNGESAAPSDRPTRYTASPALVRAFTDAAARRIGDKKWIVGTVASGDIFVGDSATRKAVADLCGAAAVEMEGAAVAQTAEWNGVPFAVIRAVSDLADGTAPASFEAFQAQAAALSADILLDMLAHSDDWRDGFGTARREPV